MNEPYRIPSETCRTEIIVNKSRFVATIGYATTTDEAKVFIQNVREQMSAANHHVYAFRLGYGKSITEGMTDDGEPKGTAGPPSLAVLQGSNIGDVVLVTTRYFGGTKLGTGGLVRAYTQSAQLAVETVKTRVNVKKSIVGIDIPYHLYDILKRLIAEYNGLIQDETFAGEISIIIEFVESVLVDFQDDLREQTSGQVDIVILS